MDTLLVTVSRINRTKEGGDDGYENEEVIQFYRQEIPMWKIEQDKPHLLREIIAICNDLTLTKE
jgi:hypothetical protein